jgi:hypothetical protein
LRWASIGITLCCLLLSQAFAQKRQPSPKAPSAERDLALLDSDAGLIISLKISQIQDLHDLVVDTFPKDRGSLNLAAMGATAMLGFHPFQSAAWSDKGFATDSRMLMQIGAIDRKAARKADRGKGVALWRTRILLRASDAGKARETLSRIRFRKASRLEDPPDKSFDELLGARGGAASKLKKKLRAAGVFLVAEPAPLPGLLLISQRGDLFVIEVLAPYGPSDLAWKWGDHQDLLVTMIQRKRQLLPSDVPGSEALSDGSFSVWLRGGLVGEALAANELDAEAPRSMLRRRPACEPFAQLARRSEFQALSLVGNFRPDAVLAELRWHLGEKSDLPSLLGTESAPLLRASKQPLRATVRLAQPGNFRGRKRAPVAAAWDSLWRQARLCGPASRVLALALAWPQIAGLFLDEVSALHPEASSLIDSLGSLQLAAFGEAKNQELLAEAWVQSPGDGHARKWLKALFGHERKGKKITRWSRGKMRPYAIDRPGGSVIGAFLGPGLADMKLDEEGRRGSIPESIFELRARPRDLRPELLQHPLLAPLAAWKGLSADLKLRGRTLHFLIHAKKD